MEEWFPMVIIFFCIYFLIISIFNKFGSSTKLPPGPSSIPIFTNVLWLLRSPLQIESLLRGFAKYGPIITVPIGDTPAIFIADRLIAHKALLQNAALFSDRPAALAMNKIISSHHYNLTSAPYGPLWRLFRRNLTSQTLHPSHVRTYNRARKWVLDILLNRLQSHSELGNPVCVVGDHFQFAMFCLLALMCFGDKLDESQIKEIENLQHMMLINLQHFIVLNFWPKLTNILFRNRKVLFSQLRRKQQDVLIPLINVRKKANQNRENREEKEEEFVVSYVDTLLELELPDQKRKLTDDEIVTLCSEFLNAGTGTTSSALQWIMANLVKNPEIQNKILAEMKGVMGDGTGEEEVKEEDLGKLPYLKAVVLEGLRRHPPAHFVLPHAVKEDTMLENYVIPKNGSVNFMVAEMGWDPKVWENPMEFKPERFMKGEEFDITGSKEIKMMPFGAGRRICPAIHLAMLHLEYFIANLVKRFQWKAVDGDDVDLSEKMEFTVVMKNPLKVNIFSRF